MKYRCDREKQHFPSLRIPYFLNFYCPECNKKRLLRFNRDKEGNFTKKKVSLTGKVKINNVWSYIVGGGNSVEYGTKHPAAFPLELAKDHIFSWSNEGDLVYDPFMGSGTVALACIKMNRQWIGSEISTIYCDYINERINKEN
jgi:site-specific DNA-methyltransferase (adenine-specific)